MSTKFPEPTKDKDGWLKFKDVLLPVDKGGYTCSWDIDGYCPENLSEEQLIKEKYRGIRPAAGYPACPDHTEKQKLWELMDVEPVTGINLTESYAMWPGAAVSGLYFAHPKSRYFSINKITKDQAEHYAKLKGQPIEEIERWLSPVLGY